MLRQKLKVAAALAIAIALASASHADDIAPKLKERMAAAAREDDFSGAVIVAKDGKPLLREAYGQANIELEVPNRVETIFRLGSITKQFTAMAIMILAERQKLAVDDPVSKHLENAPQAWEKITIRHLLNHTSGIPSYTGFPQMMSRTVRLPATVDEIIAIFKDKELEFQPGEKFAYNNSAYILVGKIIERASGQDYETFVRENIFQPLAMNDSGYDHSETILPRRAAGYVRTPKGRANAPFLDMSWPYAAGSLYSTVDDLARWDEALSEGNLINRESYDAMFAPGKSNYAFGWFVDERDGHKQIHHGGGIHGFSTEIYRYPDDKLCVVVLSNVIPSGAQRIARDLAGIALGLENKLEPNSKP